MGNWKLISGKHINQDNVRLLRGKNRGHTLNDRYHKELGEFHLTNDGLTKLAMKLLASGDLAGNADSWAILERGNG